MTITSLLPDLIALAIVAVFCVLGGKRGMFRTFSGLLSVLVSVAGALFIANYGAQLIAEYFLPFLLPVVEEWLAGIVTESASGSEIDLGVLGLVPGVRQLMENVSAALVETIAPAVAEEVAGAVAWVALFIIGFIVCNLVCKLILLLLDMIDHLPGLHFLNHLIGAVLGALKGFLLVLLAAKVLVWFDVLPEDVMAATALLKWMVDWGSVH